MDVILVEWDIFVCVSEFYKGVMLDKVLCDYVQVMLSDIVWEMNIVQSECEWKFKLEGLELNFYGGYSVVMKYGCEWYLNDFSFVILSVEFWVLWVIVLCLW